MERKNCLILLGEVGEKTKGEHRPVFEIAYFSGRPSMLNFALPAWKIC